MYNEFLLLIGILKSPSLFLTHNAINIENIANFIIITLKIADCFDLLIFFFFEYKEFCSKPTSSPL